MDFKILVIGLGSMGKRRIRNLQALGQKNIAGFDLRQDRCSEVTEKYGVKTFTLFEDAILYVNPNSLIISVPPDIHHLYMKYSVEHGIPAFIEASVVDYDLESIIEASRKKNVLLAPSSTLSFHPAIRKIKKIIDEKYLGKLSNILYHSGQYLLDWHSYENVKDFYVSKKETGGAREIVPFELTWITKIFGFPESVVGMYKKTIHIEGAEDIEDTYNALLDFNTFMMSFTVDVVSRIATRKLTINGDKRQLYWNWDDNLIKVYNPESDVWEEFPYETIAAEYGYNKNITEQIYIDEVQCFLNAVSGKSPFENSLENDHKILKILYAIEKSYEQKKINSLK